MAHRVFLDVGAYTGDVTRLVLHGNYGFDRVYAFEPQLALCETIRGIVDPRLTVCPFGLWDRTGTFPFYVVLDSKRTGGSVYADKIQPRASQVLSAEFVSASEWFRAHLRDDETVILKMNCEGAECAILDDLFQSGEARKLHGVAVAFDVRKVPSEAHREAATRERLAQVPGLRVYVLEERECYRKVKRHGVHAFLDHWMAQVV